MVEGGLRPHWIQQTIHVNVLKKMHAKRIQNAACGNNTQEGTVLNQNTLLHPLLLGCGVSLGAGLVCSVELALFHLKTWTRGC